MTSGAKVGSIEALDSFRSSLIVYISKARPSLEEIGAEVMRSRMWLENDQRIHWETQVRRRAQTLETARQELFAAGISVLRRSTSDEIRAVRRAENALEEAQNKLNRIKKWTRDFDSQAAPLVKQLEKLETLLANDLPEAVAYLGSVIKTLGDYASSLPPQPTPSADADAPNPTEPPPPSA